MRKRKKKSVKIQCYQIFLLGSNNKCQYQFRIATSGQNVKIIHGEKQEMKLVNLIEKEKNLSN